MRIFSWSDIMAAYKTKKRLCDSSAVTVGSFDGLHRGHRALIARMDNYIQTCAEKPAQCAVTFSRPTRAKKNETYLGDILTLPLKLKLFRELGFDFVIVIDFSEKFARMSGQKFFEILVKTICMNALFVGHDFSCGFRHRTDSKALEKISAAYAFVFDSIERVSADGLEVSSSAIRQALSKADFAKAEKLLGYSFLLDISNAGFERLSAYEWEAPTENFVQVLPPSGTYEVELFTVEGFKLPACCIISERSVLVRIAENFDTRSDRTVAAESLWLKKYYVKFI
ncbi:MAG: FAD synthetase family protein [Treponemataceae bacterium]